MSTLDKEYRNYSVKMGLITFVISFFLMVLIGLYLEHVVPREHGKRYHPCFCFMKSFWCRKINQVSKEQGEKSVSQDFFELNKTFETQLMNKEYYEGVPPAVARLEASKKIMKIQGIEKTYDSGVKAVQGINLKMF